MLAIKLIDHYGAEVGTFAQLHTTKPLNPTLPSVESLKKQFLAVKKYVGESCFCKRD